MINEKYKELLQEITKLIASKNNTIENLYDEIIELKKKLRKAERKKGI